MTKRKWRILPHIQLVNYKTNSPNLGLAFRRWFYFSKLWSGRLWYFGIKHYALELDWRYDWVADMKGPNHD